MRYLFLLTALLALSSCSEDLDGTQIRVRNETQFLLRDIDYAFGFAEEARSVNRLAPGQASSYHRFDNADRCSGWRLSGEFEDGETINFGVARCAIPEPMPPGRYSLLVRREEIFVNDRDRTVVRTEIVED